MRIQVPFIRKDAYIWNMQSKLCNPNLPTSCDGVAAPAGRSNELENPIIRRCYRPASLANACIKSCNIGNGAAQQISYSLRCVPKDSTETYESLIRHDGGFTA